MSELDLLRLLLLTSMALAPLGTHRFFFPKPSRLEVGTYLGALACAAAGLFSPLPQLCAAWLLFCAASFARFLWSRGRSLCTYPALAACVPFLFSNVAAVWLVAGSNDLRLLGYEQHFSYYASLHGNVLGWTLVGAVAILANREAGNAQRVHLAVVLVCLVSFLAIALGIDRLHALKPFGVFGLSFALPASQWTFLRSVWARDRAALALAGASLGGLILTMVLAWANHLSLFPLPPTRGVRAMVSLHGVLNALVVAPCFLFAVTRSAQPRPTSTQDPPPSGVGMPDALSR
ncbi:MAG: YndJ family transporter [Deltaproteobacteria bacterium]|jgi:hypothetical protein